MGDLKQYGQWTRIQQGAEQAYREWHRPGAVWPELLQLLRRSGYRDYSIFMRGQELFAAFKAEDASVAAERMAQDPIFHEWMALMAPFMDAEDPLDPWRPMDSVFRLE